MTTTRRPLGNVGLALRLLCFDLRAAWRWLAGLALVWALNDGVMLAESLRVGPVCTFNPLFGGLDVQLVFAAIAIVTLAFGLPTRARVWPFLQALPVSTRVLLAARLGFVFFVVVGAALARVVVYAALGAPTPALALTIAVALRVALFATFSASLLSSVWLMPRALQLVSVAVAFVLGKLPVDDDAVWPTFLVREAAATDDGPLPWKTVGIMVVASVVFVASCEPFFRRRLAERFCPRPFVRRFAPAWAVIAGVIVMLPDAAPSGTRRVTAPAPVIVPAETAGALPSGWPELLPGSPPTATMARALDAVPITSRLLQQAGLTMPRIVVARVDTVGVDTRWVGDDVLVLSVAGDTQTEILAQRLVGELVHHAAPDVDLSIVNPLAAVVGWAIDDTLPGPRPQRRLRQIERRASCEELGARGAQRASGASRAMASAFFADVVDAGEGEPALVAMLREVLQGAPDNHLALARSVPGMADACAVPPSKHARVVVRPSLPVALEVHPLGGLAATVIVRVAGLAALTAKITVTRSEPLSPGTATTLTEFTVDGARLGDGVPIGLAVERGSTIVVTVDADSSEGDVLVAATLSQAVTIP